MNFKKVLESIINFEVMVIHFQTGRLLYSGKVKNISDELRNKGWLVHEAKLSDENNLNSNYILTVY